MTITIRQAGAHDTESIAELWTEASRWLASRGYSQWQYPVRIDGIARDVAAGTVWLAEHDNGELVGTITIDSTSSSGLWRPEELVDAIIIHRFVVRRRYTGCGIGARLLQHAEDIGRQHARRWIRLDAWTDNTDLHRYYRRAGFRFVRVADTSQLPSPARRSAALFERRIP
jgi:GNAT superfamily N-acetyltransferase